MDVNLDVAGWLTAEQIVALAIRGYPRSVRRIHDRAATEGWALRTVPSQGRTGHRREYKLPLAVQMLIEAVQRDEIASAAPLKDPTNTPASNKTFNEMRVAERRINSVPKPPGRFDTPEDRLRFAKESLDLIKAGYSAEWLATGEGPMRTPPPRPHRLNMEAWKAILRGALKKTPNPDPDELIEWCAVQYDFYMDNGMITEDGVGEGNLGAAA